MTIETPDIKIYKINHALIKIACEQDIAMELSEAFSFFVDGAKYSPTYRSGRWDGFIKLFSIGSRTMGGGLINHVIDFGSNRGYSVEIVDDSKKTGYEPPNYKLPITLQETRLYMESLNLHGRGVPLEIRDYQINGVWTALHHRTAILEAATGSGKSMMIYGIFRYLTEVLGLRCLLIVPTVGLVTQMKSDFKDYSSATDWKVDDNVHQISAGVDKNTTKPIVISTFQSLKTVDKSWLNSFQCIMSDEGHKIQAASFKNIYDRATEVPYRLACTGTLHDTKCNLLLMKALCGNTYQIAIAKDLIAAQQLVPLKIKSISLNYPLETCKLFKKMEYEDEINWIVTNPKRNNFIKNLAIRCKGTTLIFFRLTSQGTILRDLIKAAVTDRPVFYFDGDVHKDERESMRLEANVTDALVVCSYGIFSAGVNLPNVRNMIFAHPTKSRINVLQSIGRGLRLSEDKTHCNLYDIGDNLSYRSNVNHTYRHFGVRLELLTREGYEFDLVNVDF